MIWQLLPKARPAYACTESTCTSQTVKPAGDRIPPCKCSSHMLSGEDRSCSAAAAAASALHLGRQPSVGKVTTMLTEANNASSLSRSEHQAHNSKNAPYLGRQPSVRSVRQLLTSLPLESPSGAVNSAWPSYAPLASTAAIMSWDENCRFMKAFGCQRTCTPV